MKQKFLIALSSIIMAVAFLSCSKSGNNPSTPSPVANFSYSAVASNLHAPSTIDFTNSSSGATSYSWDFGDGTSSTTYSPSHKYDNAGIYTAKLTATSAGQTNTKTVSMNILAAYSAVQINKITLTSSTETSSVTGYFRFVNSSNVELYKTSNVLINPNTLPAAWTLSTPYTFYFLTLTYYVEVWKVGIFSDTKVASTPFIPSLYNTGTSAVNSYPTSVSGLQGITLGIAWQ